MPPYIRGHMARFSVKICPFGLKYELSGSFIFIGLLFSEHDKLAEKVVEYHDKYSAQKLYHQFIEAHHIDEYEHDDDLAAV